VLTTGGGLAFDGNTPPGIYLATGGVRTNALNTNDWAWPLSQPSQASAVQLNWNPILFSTPTNLFGSETNDGPFTFNYDTNYFTTNSTGLTLNPLPGTNILWMGSTNGVLTPVRLDPNWLAISNLFSTPSNSAPTLTLTGPPYTQPVLASVTGTITMSRTVGDVTTNITMINTSGLVSSVTVTNYETGGPAENLVFLVYLNAPPATTNLYLFNTTLAKAPAASPATLPMTATIANPVRVVSTNNPYSGPLTFHFVIGQ
jgi:hypothetical protein